MLASLWGVALLTWAPLMIEIGLAASLLLAQRRRWRLFVAGALFHLSIAVMTAIWSFALAMIGGLVVLCLPLGSHLHVTVPEAVRGLLRQGTAVPELPAGADSGAKPEAEYERTTPRHASSPPTGPSAPVGWQPGRLRPAAPDPDPLTRCDRQLTGPRTDREAVRGPCGATGGDEIS
ncbi:hypothetical protein [Streptomyces cyaneofuscatus]|uniref:hypothetical protein n=1 Tax=Streptomyces cyaneofuscatus TaxID=66883 RepID=UPI0036597A26